jgi:chromosomal replication initiator protein
MGTTTTRTEERSGIMNEIVRVSELERQHAAHRTRSKKLWCGRLARQIAKSHPLPMWKTMEMEFDWHVMLWREVSLARQLAAIAQENAALRASLRVDTPFGQVKRRLTKEIILEVLSCYPGIIWEDIKSGRREHRIVVPKHRCIFAVYRQRPDMSLPQIGRLFGMDHTSILFVIKKQLAEAGDKDAAKWIAGKRKRARDWHRDHHPVNEGK